VGKKIVVVGSSNTDMILQSERVPKAGETILGGRFSTAAGGKGANQAVASARAGGDVHFIARLGDDMFGQKALAGFKQDNINTEHVFIDGTAPSGVALIFVADDGENIIGVGPGANSNLSTDDIISAQDTIASADIVLMQLEIPIPTVKKAASIGAQAGAAVILNPAPAQPLSDELLSNISLLTPNESEAELLTGIKIETEKDAEKAAKALLEKGIQQVIITMGSKGVFVFNADGGQVVSGFEVKPVDTTGAGDVFNGALAVAVAEGKSLQEASVFANAAAALSVTKLGAQPSVPTRAEIEDFLKSTASG
jgi:ribokinase